MVEELASMEVDVFSGEMVILPAFHRKKMKGAWLHCILKPILMPTSVSHCCGCVEFVSPKASKLANMAS